MIRNLALTAAAVLGATVLVACGTDDAPVADPTNDPAPTASAPASTPATTPASPATTAATSPVTTPATTPATNPATNPAAPTPDPTGDGDSTDDDEPATAGGGVCGELDAAEVGAIVGAKLAGRGLSGAPGCEFVAGQKLNVTVVDRTAAKAGGMAGAKSEATSTVEGNPEDVPGLGRAAFVVTGSVFGGPETQGAGAVQVRDRIVLVTWTQHRGDQPATVRTTVLALLKKIAGELA